MFFCEKWVTNHQCCQCFLCHRFISEQWTSEPADFHSSQGSHQIADGDMGLCRVDKWAHHLYNGYKSHNWSSILYKLVFLAIHHFIGNFMIPKGPYVCLPTTSLFTSSWRLFDTTPQQTFSEGCQVASHRFGLSKFAVKMIRIMFCT